MKGDAAAFIRASLRLEPVPGLGGVVLHTAHPGSQLSRLGLDAAPYWAYPWAGGLALAHHFRANPDLVAGKRVLDLGAGSGLVGIVAARLGAMASAAEIDRNGVAAIRLNAEANGVALPVVEVDAAGSAPLGFDLIAAGDVFYSAEVAALMLPFLERCAAAGIAALVGDPRRRDLPVERLERLAEYLVADVGDARDKPERMGAVYRVRQAPRSAQSP